MRRTVGETDRDNDSGQVARPRRLSSIGDPAATRDSFPHVSSVHPRVKTGGAA